MNNFEGVDNLNKEENKKTPVLEVTSTTSIEIETVAGMTVEECIKEIVKRANNGEYVHLEVNDVILDSSKIKTEDDAYILIFGKNKAEFEEMKNSKNKSGEKSELLDDGKIKQLLDNGKGLVNEEKFENWENYVKNNINNMYNGEDIKLTIDILKKIEGGKNLKEIKDYIENLGLSNYLHSVVKNRVNYFSKVGIIF